MEKGLSFLMSHKDVAFATVEDDKPVFQSILNGLLFSFNPAILKSCFQSIKLSIFQ